MYQTWDQNLKNHTNFWPHSSSIMILQSSKVYLSGYLKSLWTVYWNIGLLHWYIVQHYWKPLHNDKGWLQSRGVRIGGDSREMTTTAYLLSCLTRSQYSPLSCSSVWINTLSALPTFNADIIDSISKNLSFGCLNLERKQRIGHANVQSCLFSILQYESTSLQFSSLGVKQPNV